MHRTASIRSTRSTFDRIRARRASRRARSQGSQVVTVDARDMTRNVAPARVLVPSPLHRTISLYPMPRVVTLGIAPVLTPDENGCI